MDKRSRIFNLRLKYTLLFLVATVCLVQHALADSIRDAFEKLRSKKVKDHRMSSDIKGAICTRDGMDKKDFKSMVINRMKWNDLSYEEAVVLTKKDLIDSYYIKKQQQKYRFHFDVFERERAFV